MLKVYWQSFLLPLSTLLHKEFFSQSLAIGLFFFSQVLYRENERNEIQLRFFSFFVSSSFSLHCEAHKNKINLLVLYSRNTFFIYSDIFQRFSENDDFLEGEYPLNYKKKRNLSFLCYEIVNVSILSLPIYEYNSLISNFLFTSFFYWIFINISNADPFFLIVR